MGGCIGDRDQAFLFILYASIKSIAKELPCDTVLIIISPIPIVFVLKRIRTNQEILPLTPPIFFFIPAILFISTRTKWLELVDVLSDLVLYGIEIRSSLFTIRCIRWRQGDPLRVPPSRLSCMLSITTIAIFAFFLILGIPSITIPHEFILLDIYSPILFGRNKTGQYHIFIRATDINCDGPFSLLLLFLAYEPQFIFRGQEVFLIKGIICATSWDLTSGLVPKQGYELLHAKVRFLGHHVRLPEFAPACIEIVLDQHRVLVDDGR